MLWHVLIRRHDSRLQSLRMMTVMPNRANREEVFAGRLFSVDTVRWQSDACDMIERDVVRHPGAVLIIPVLDNGNVVMIRNHRVAVEQTLWEFPAGTAEPEEPAERTAAREVEEETGYRASSIQPIGMFYTSPGFCDELMRVFVATGLQHVGQNLEAHENITVHEMPLDEVRKMAVDGRLLDGKSIAAIFLLDAAKKGTGVFFAGADAR